MPSKNLLTELKEIKPNTHLLHLSVIRQLNNKRAGTASTKTKSEVRGGGKKPWKQKGTGRARAGSIRSPLWVGGGITFGPKPRDFSFDLPKKASNISLAHALAARSADVISLKKLPELKEPKTKLFVQALKTIENVTAPTLIIVSKTEPGYENIKRASKNIPTVTLLTKDTVGTYDVMKAKSIIITEAASSELSEKLSSAITNSKNSSKNTESKKK